MAYIRGVCHQDSLTTGIQIGYTLPKMRQGHTQKKKLDVQAGDTPTQKHALKAILKHMNDWATDKLSSNPDIETNAVESEIELKK